MGETVIKIFCIKSEWARVGTCACTQSHTHTGVCARTRTRDPFIKISEAYSDSRSLFSIPMLNPNSL